MIITQNYTWPDARTQCSNNDGYLWVVNDANEYNNVRDLYIVVGLLDPINGNHDNHTVWV